MAKRVVKKRRKKIRWTGMASFILFLSITMYLFSRVFIQTENTRLMREIQDVELQIAEVQTENEVLVSSVQDLRNYNRVVSIAHKAGLETNNNAITITQGEE